MRARRTPRQALRQRGAALLLALLVASLVATLAAGTVWRQWRDIDIERAERERDQAAWMLLGALDWARLILRQDIGSSSIDHLAEPWAVPLRASRLSGFLRQRDGEATDPLLDALVSGQIEDAQSRLNLRNLVQTRGGRAIVSTPDLAAFQTLFKALGLPEPELDRATQALLRTLTPAAASGNAAPLPQRFEQLVWLGLSEVTLERLAPHATWLPERTALNINTSGALALSASADGLDMARAQQVLNERERAPFDNLSAAARRLPRLQRTFQPLRHTTSSRYFLVHGSLQLGRTVLRERALLQRRGRTVEIVWRQRLPGLALDGGSLQ